MDLEEEYHKVKGLYLSRSRLTEVVKCGQFYLRWCVPGVWTFRLLIIFFILYRLETSL